jgi:DNA polymerase-3 subunit beta
MAVFKKPGIAMLMRLIDGQFPEYQRVIPKEGEKVVMVSKVRFLESLKRIALLSADKSYAVRIGLEQNKLLITANNPDLGEAKDVLEVAYRGGDITIGFNARYLTDVLSVLETEEISFELGDEHSPGVIHAPGDRSFTAVVMPMRV